MNMNHLLYFLTLCEYGRNFAQAAKALYIAPSTLTAAIKKMENDLECKLIDRETLVLTPEGEALQETAAEILDIWNSFEKRIKTNKADDIIRLGVDTTLLDEKFGQILDLFHKKHPETQVSIYRHSSINIEDNLRDHNIDLGIMMLNDEKKSAFDYFGCMDIEYGLYLHKDHSLSSQKNILPKQVENSNLNLVNLVDDIVAPLEKYFKEHNSTIKPGAITIKNYQDVYRFINIDCNTAAIMPIMQGDNFNDIKVLPFSPPIIIKYTFVKNHSIELTQTQRQFVKFISGHYQ